MDLGACLGAGEAETHGVGFKDDGAVEDVAAEGSEEEGGGVGCDVERFEGGEFEDCGEGGGGWDIC